MSYFKVYIWYSFGNRKISREMEVSTNMSYPLEELISMLELLVSNIPELGHPPVDTTEGGVRFWLCPELGDATSGPAPVSESGPKAAGGGFTAFLDFDLDPPCTKVPCTTCTMPNRIENFMLYDICLGRCRGFSV